jgi:hypothetical protein
MWDSSKYRCLCLAFGRRGVPLGLRKIAMVPVNGRQLRRAPGKGMVEAVLFAEVAR